LEEAKEWQEQISFLTPLWVVGRAAEKLVYQFSLNKSLMTRDPKRSHFGICCVGFVMSDLA
jgi:hypothetical protein